MRLYPPESNSAYLAPGAIGGPSQAELRIDVLETAVRLLWEDHIEEQAHFEGDDVGRPNCNLCRLAERALKP